MLEGGDFVGSFFIGLIPKFSWGRGSVQLNFTPRPAAAVQAFEKGSRNDDDTTWTPYEGDPNRMTRLILMSLWHFHFHFQHVQLNGMDNNWGIAVISVKRT